MKSPEVVESKNILSGGIKYRIPECRKLVLMAKKEPKSGPH